MVNAHQAQNVHGMTPSVLDLRDSFQLREELELAPAVGWDDGSQSLFRVFDTEVSYRIGPFA
jgi:hypothetical protein